MSLLQRLWQNMRGSQSTDNTGLVLVPQHSLSANQMSANAVKVVERLQQKGYDAFIVGGCLRDLLLGRRPKDFDVATSAHPDQVKDLFHNCRLIGRRFRLAHVYFGREVIEVATFRGHHHNAKKSRADKKGHAQQNAQGMLVADNVYGTLAEDAERRDFTVNTFYYDPVKNQLRCYPAGLADLKNKTLRLLGDPETRYREDPVRILRAIRFVAKLDFKLAPETQAPILQLGALLRDIPGARLFDEILKLFHSGQGLTCFSLIQHYQLLPHLFPDTYPLLNQGASEFTRIWFRLMELAIQNTDRRLAEGKSVTPAFLFAVILWPVFSAHRLQLIDRNEVPYEAMHRAASMTLDQQLTATVIPRRFSTAIREIWELQFRLTQRAGRRADILLEHPRFRAAYDFLLLREQAGEVMPGLGQWWTQYQTADENQRRHMIKALMQELPPSRRRRRKK